MAAAISGSASAKVAEKKESTDEAGLALEAVIGGISPRPQDLKWPAVGSVKAVGKIPCPYHTGGGRPRDRPAVAGHPGSLCQIWWTGGRASPVPQAPPQECQLSDICHVSLVRRLVAL